jgi:hypothetical protein
LRQYQAVNQGGGQPDIYAIRGDLTAENISQNCGSDIPKTHG